ncbi:hypothetical protein BTGOE1_16770 [Bacillus thuringiensis]|nr:hypothetical protein BTGOE1_16770 [Bacillus thuringiensis]OFC84728.1 hypothetical protein BTGOE2_11790 [Bacillus thuringiensis]
MNLYNSFYSFFEEGDGLIKINLYILMCIYIKNT